MEAIVQNSKKETIINIKIDNLLIDTMMVILEKDNKLILRFCDPTNLEDYYPSNILDTYAPEYISKDEKKTLHMHIPCKYKKILFSNASSEELQLKSIDNTIIIGDELVPFKIEDVLTNDTELQYKFLSLDFNESKCRSFDIINEILIETNKNVSAKEYNIDDVLDYYTFDSFNEFMDLMNIIKRKYADEYIINFCNYNTVDFSYFNYIELHDVCDSRHFNHTIEIRLGYKERNKKER